MSLTDEQKLRYARQMLIPEIGPRGQEKLSRGKVLAIGAGGLGSPALFYLAAAGVGTLGVADFDVVDLSNLQRQILHSTPRLGWPKAVSAEKTLRELNPHVTVRLHPIRLTAGNITEIIRDYDLVLDCTDRFETKLMINDACVAAGKPFVHAGVLETHGQIMTWIPGDYPCLRCISGNDPAASEAESSAVSGILGAAAGVMGTLQAMEAIKFLTGTGRLLTGRMLHFDGMGLTFTETTLPQKSPYCRTCGKLSPTE